MDPGVLDKQGSRPPAILPWLRFTEAAPGRTGPQGLALGRVRQATFIQTADPAPSSQPKAFGSPLTPNSVT